MSNSLYILAIIARITQQQQKKLIAKAKKKTTTRKNKKDKRGSWGFLSVFRFEVRRKNEKEK